MIEDVFLTSLKRGANPKSIRIWYKLNEGNRIQVRTGAGLSKYAEVGAVVGQGTIGGALGSQAVLVHYLEKPRGYHGEWSASGGPKAKTQGD